MLAEVAPNVQKNKCKHKYLSEWIQKAFPTREPPLFMGYQKFNKWMNNNDKAKSGLSLDQRELLNYFIDSKGIVPSCSPKENDVINGDNIK